MVNSDSASDHSTHLDKLFGQYCQQPTTEGRTEAKLILADEVNSINPELLRAVVQNMKVLHDDDIHKREEDRNNRASNKQCGVLDCENDIPAVSSLPTLSLVEDRNDQIKGVNLKGLNCNSYIKYEPESTKSGQSNNLEKNDDIK